MRVRGLVTAEDLECRSHLVADEGVVPVSGHLDWFPAWGWDELPGLPVHHPISGTPACFPDQAARGSLSR